MESAELTGCRGAAVSTRRQFLVAGAAPLIVCGLVRAAEPVPPPPKAFDRKLKLGLIGAGGRGRWIANLFKQHGGYEIWGVADYFEDVAKAAGKALGADEARCFGGLQGYKRLLESGVEAVVIIDVPYFYPEQATAAVQAGVNVYMAKPVATDVPGTLAIGAAGKLATEKRLAFLVDYQLPLDPSNIEVATRVREGAIGPIAHIISYGFTGMWGDPPKTQTIESRLRGGTWLSDIALGGDGVVAYDIHIIDAVQWLMGRRPVAACGFSRTCRPNPNGDRTDCLGVVYEYADGVVWTHITQTLANEHDVASLTASFYGMKATARLAYWGKCYVRGGDKHFVKDAGSVYDQGAMRNIANFYDSIIKGDFTNLTAQRAVDGTLTAILAREAAARRRYLTMDELIKENKRLEVSLEGLKS
ncbi:MAG TPA: Gfo/Idh/MocA family oxidoreductase [Planctomycetota bacterium]|nr:Gfo/Idh/MocA family oxidoreductase [Planctomycetota bacterium]HRR81005.1 Gfo/Idh/MocA family oxidoreductase [Planctomycetota bacterium]HRT93637.1 Gfo/Idh/MocA family oxidoreductase [Planctomycetota bacterium]